MDKINPTYFGPTPPSVPRDVKTSEPAALSAGDTKKAVAKVAARPSLRRLMVKRGIKGKPGLSFVRTMLWYNITAIQSSGSSPLVSYIDVSVGNNLEVIGEWAALYDEVKVHGGIVKIQHKVGSFPNQPCNAVCVYDPLDNQPLAALTDGLEHSQHMLWAVPGAATAPLMQTRDGLITFRFEVHPVSGVEVNTNAAPGQWHDLKQLSSSGTSDGWLKFYAESSGTNNHVVQVVFGLDVTFRSRT